MRKISPDDPVIDGRVVGERFHMHNLTSSGAPLVHISQKDRPEIVLFGSDHAILTPCVVFAGSEIVIRGSESGSLTISRLTAGEKDDRIRTDANLEAMLEGIVEVGGSYADVVHAISEAKQVGCLESRIAFSAIPDVGRTYRRDQSIEEDRKSDVGSAELAAATPDLSLPTRGADLDAITERLLAPEPQSESVSEPTEMDDVVPEDVVPEDGFSADGDNTPEFLFDDEIGTSQ